MIEKKKLADVFKTVGLPPYTYIKPSYYGEVRADISQPGKHLLIEGPSGIGKTCVAFKVFEELGWEKDKDFSYVSCRDADGAERVDAFFSAASRGEVPAPSLTVVDDFHLLTVDVYAESCRYYLVFLDANYREKVWTKYEKDVMTRPGRKEHIIPVILDDGGAGGAVGIPATVGRIDLRDVWTEIRKTAAVSKDAINALRNRCVLPILEKLDATSGSTV